MSIAAIGVDLVLVEDIARSIERFGDRFLHRVYTPVELRECGEDTRRRDERLAARFAAKEAVMKVLRPADDALPWTDIEVATRSGGAPMVTLGERAGPLARRADIDSIEVSITHHGAYACAFAVGQCAGTNQGGRES